MINKPISAQNKIRPFRITAKVSPTPAPSATVFATKCDPASSTPIMNGMNLKTIVMVRLTDSSKNEFSSDGVSEMRERMN